MEFMERSGQCSEDEFWNCVEEIGWNDESPLEYEQVKAKLLRAWTPEFGDSFDKILTGHRNDLGKRLLKYETQMTDAQRNGYWLSDDGYGDLLNHIVGLGREVFMASMEDPSLMIQRAKSGKYLESFAYCIPAAPAFLRFGNEKLSFHEWAHRDGYCLNETEWNIMHKGMFERHPSESFEQHLLYAKNGYANYGNGDWSKVNPEYWARRAEEYLPPFAAFLAVEKPSPEKLGDDAECWDRAVSQAAILVRYLLFLTKENAHAAYDCSMHAMDAWWDLYEMSQVQLHELGPFLTEADKWPFEHPHGGSNLINDHRVYMCGAPRIEER